MPATARGALQAWSCGSLYSLCIPEPVPTTLVRADLFCWMWAYSKRSQIILFSPQEHLKCFKPLCLKAWLKPARTAHRTEKPQKAAELLGSIKLFILYRILMILGCMPSIKRTWTWSKKSWRAFSVFPWIWARGIIRDLLLWREL